MTNRLPGQTSPYLLQHADNPVDWWPWCEEAFAEARRSDRPVLLSVGYAACHWCHVMAHESFEDPATAEVMNRLFVNIKVDREERPDVDQIYMAALHALGQQGGWPLTMFLTPAGEPFWGGTYFPPVARYGRPSFRDVLEAVARTCREDPDRVAHNTAALVAHLREPPAGEAGQPLTEGLLAAAGQRLSGIMDRKDGGLPGAPKFPQPSLLALLFRHAARSGDDAAAAAALVALERMSEGGIYDHLGGGYARYSVDDRWLVPHFEKMLYDNGQLLPLLARAHAITGRDLFRRRIEETVDWLRAEMLVEGGGFASSLDADTEGEEGLTYVWTEPEIDAVLGSDAPAFKAAYGVTPGGNFEGRTILNRLDRPRDADEEAAMAPLRAKLKAVRDRRPQPGRDDKVLADWNALAIRGLAEAGALIGRPDWIALARGAYAFVRERMADGDFRLAHATREGRSVRPGLASDHAGMALAAIALHDATFEPGLLDDADRWLAILDRHYGDGTGLFYLTAEDAPPLIVRPKPFSDEATPNHHGVIVEASVRLHLATGEQRHLDRADALLAAAGPLVAANVLGAASLLAAFALRLDLPTVVVVGPAGDDRDALLAAARRAEPDAVPFAAESTADLPAGHPAAGKPAAERPLSYLCRAGACSLPIDDPAGFAAARIAAGRE